MSKILDLQKRANNLLSQHQNDIDEKLNSEISQIFKDMRNTVQSEAQSLSSSIDSTKTDIQQKQSEATNEILQQIDQTTAQTKKQQQQGMTALLQEQQQQIKQLQANLQQLNGLSQENSQSSQIKENPYYIEYSLDFTGMYNAYQQYLSGIRQQEQVQRHHRDGEQSPVAKKPRGEPEYSEVWNREKMGLVRPDRPSAAVQQQYANSAGNQLNESRSTVIADYRAATAAAQRATEAARASITAHSNAEQNDKRTRELLQQIDNSLQHADRERKRDEKSYQTATESEAIRDFITKLGEQLKTAITEPFRAISDWVKSKERDQRTIANDDLYRNREADSTIDPTASKETRLSATVSRKIRGFDQTNIFKALDELDRRRELQLEQQRKNDKSYSPRF